MRAGELIGRTVADADGRPVGVCTDLRFWVTHGVPDTAPELRLAAILVSPRHAGSLLGYERGRTRGPRLLAALVRRLHRGMVLIPWADVGEVPDDRERAVRLRSGASPMPMPG